MSEVTITIKVSGGSQFTTTISTNLSVRELKEKVADQCTSPPEQQRLIFKGRILKDEDVLSNLQVENGHVMHLVRSAASAATSNTEKSQTVTPTPVNTVNSSFAASIDNNNLNGAAAANNPAMGFGGLGGLGGMGGMGNMGAMQNDPLFSMLANSLGTGMNNNAGGNNNPAAANAFNADPNNFARNFGGISPEVIQSMMGSPMVQQAMNEISQNPEILRSMIQSNPMLSQMANSNPMLNQILETPDMLRSMMNSQFLQSSMQMQMQMMRNNGNNEANPNASTLPSAPIAGTPGAIAGAPGAIATAPNPFASMGQGTQQNPNFNQLSSMLNNPALMSMLNQQLGAATQNTPPTDNYPSAATLGTQLDQLYDMGFIDRDANVQALQNSSGDINGAISHLLERGIGQ